MDKAAFKLYAFTHSKTDPVILNLPLDSTGQDLIDYCLRNGLINSAESMNIFIGEDDSPVLLSEKLSAKGAKNNSSVHLNSCNKISVVANYNGQSKEAEFTPVAKIKKVFNWATKSFGMSDNDAADKVLRLQDGTELDNPDAQIGSYTGGTSCQITLDLTLIEVIKG